MRITSKGQVTIPAEIRDKLGLLPNTEVEFVIQGGHALLRKAASDGRRGRDVLRRMAGRGRVKMSTDEILSLTRGRR